MSKKVIDLSALRFTPEEVEVFDDRILVKLSQAELKTKGGIYIPNSVDDESKPRWGEVILTGPGTKDEAMRFQIGDIVFFGKYAGAEWNPAYDTQNRYFLLRSADVFGRAKQ